MNITITEQGTTRIGEYEHGNGIRYTAVAIPWTSDGYLMLGALGVVEDGWLIISGNTTRAHLFEKNGSPVDYYIQEKLGGVPGDYPYMGDLIRALVGRPTSAPVVDDMPEDPEAYRNFKAEKMP